MISILARIFTVYAVFKVWENVRYDRFLKHLAGKLREMDYKLDDIKFEWIPYYD